MSKNLAEKEIQKTAVEFLTEYYQNCSHNKKIESQLEATTKQNKRADGLIVWEKAPGIVRVVSIEAKSSNTLHSLRTRWDKEKLSKGSFLLVEIGLFLLFCFIYKYYDLRLVLEPAHLFLFLIALPILWRLMRPALKKLSPQLFQTSSVMEQLTLYPGNEAWIAIGSDTINRNRDERLAELIAQCKQRNYGLIEVQADYQAPKILLLPKFNSAVKTNDFLEYYKQESIIRELIAGKEQGLVFWWNLSKAERNYEIQRFKYAFLFSLLLPFYYLWDFGHNAFPDLSNQSPIADHHPITSPLSVPFPNVATPARAKPQKVITPVVPTVSTIIEEKSPIIISSNNCSFPFQGKKYIVKDQLVLTLRAAKRRRQLLLDIGCPDADYFWIPCSDWSGGEAAWCVYAYHPRSDQPNIQKSLVRYGYKMRVAGLDDSHGNIWWVQGNE